MKTAQEIYTAYKIQPGLQGHQLRVAGVAKLLCEKSTNSIDTDAVVLAALFHDMGNILKMHLPTFPEFLKPKGLKYWEQIKSEFALKYGNNAHQANIVIARELQLPEKVVNLIDGISFSNIAKIVSGASFEQKVCEYADCRVGPHGVLPLQDRLLEARERYLAMRSGKRYYIKDGFEALSRSAHELEAQVFSASSIKPADVSDAAVTPLMEELRNYNVA